MKEDDDRRVERLAISNGYLSSQMKPTWALSAAESKNVKPDSVERNKDRCQGKSIII